MEAVINRTVAETIMAQEELNSRSAEMLNILITDYPDLSDTLTDYWEANYNVKQ